MRRAFRWAVAAGALALGPGLAAAEQPPNGLITDMNDRLAQEPSLSDDRVEVVRQGSTLVLAGTVDSAEEKRRAEELARDAAGGDVRMENRLEMRAQGSDGEGGLERTGKAIDDAWITTKVKAQLTSDAEIDFDDVRVTVEGGVVTLTGKVKNEAARRRAVEVTRALDGVRRVVDRLEVSGR